VYGISLVENPAMEGTFIALSKQSEILFKEVDTEQRLLLGLVLEPNKPIYRNQDGEEFNIVFDEQTIKDLSHNFFTSFSQANSTIEHENKIEGVTFVESWIVENPDKDKSSNFGFSYPKGSWLATMKVDSEEIWQGYVKTGKVKGFSIDALLSLEEVNLKSNIEMSKTDSLLERILLALTPKKVDIKLGKLKVKDSDLFIEFEGEMVSIGASIWMTADDGTRVPVPVGEYIIEETGMTYVVKEEGILAELLPAPTMEEETPAEMETQEPKVSNDAKIAQEIESAIKSILIKYNEQDQKIAELETKLSTQEATIIELGKEPASKGIKQVEVSTPIAMNKKERLLQTINKFK
jgi:hypothetical protein